MLSAEVAPCFQLISHHLILHHMLAIKEVKAGHKPGSVHPPMRWVVIYLGPTLPTASSGALYRNEADGQPSFLGLAPSRGLPSQHLSMLLVRSYRTFAPLPRLLGFPH